MSQNNFEDTSFYEEEPVDFSGNGASYTEPVADEEEGYNPDEEIMEEESFMPTETDSFSMDLEDDDDDDDLDDIPGGTSFAYEQESKAKKMLLGIIAASLGLTILCFGLIGFLFVSQQNQEKSIKKWVAEYVDERIGDDLSDEEMNSLIDKVTQRMQEGQLGQFTTAGEVIDLSAITDEEIQSLVYRIKEPLLQSLNEAEAQELAEGLTVEYVKQTGNSNGAEVSATDLATLQAQIKTLQQSNKTLSSAVETISQTAGRTGATGAQGIKGDKGDRGAQGATGATGAKGADGKDGVDGKDGADGRDGVDGIDGKDGLNGKSTYIVFAEDENGTGFSTSVTSDSKYQATITTDKDLSELTADDFTGKWVQYKASGVIYDNSTGTPTVYIH